MPERIRKRCVGCTIPHLMDDLGPVQPEDEVLDALCLDAIQATSESLRAISEDERAGLEAPVPDTLFDRLATSPDVELDESGVEIGAWPAAAKVAVCILSAIILITLGALVGTLL